MYSKQQVRIRPSEPVWMTSIIRNLIRKRKRTFRKAKLTDTPANWEKFRKLRNKVISLIRESKKNRNEQLTYTLGKQRLTSKEIGGQHGKLSSLLNTEAQILHWKRMALFIQKV